MSFLFPLFLAAGAAVGLPILFHLIRRDTRERRPFSSLMFLETSPPRMQRRRRPEHLLLLALRCLAICLIALAFARPYWLQAAAAEEPREGRRTVVLLDTSASMRRAGLWEDAMARAKAALEKKEPGDKATLFTFDRTVDRNPPPLAGVKPGWGATDLGAALIAAAETLDEGEAGATARQIVLISDLQQGARREALHGFVWPPDVWVSVDQVGPAAGSNASAAFVGDGSRVRISNAAGSVAAQFAVSWEGAAPVAAGVPPGESRVVAVPEPPAEGRLTLTGDDHDFDNVLYYVRQPPRSLDVLYLGRDAESDPDGSLYYLRRAFQETAAIAPRLTAVAPDAEPVAPTGTVIVVDPPSEAWTAALRAHLDRGGRVLYVVRTPEGAAAAGRLLGAPSFDVAEAAEPAILGALDFDHPWLAPFADPRFNDFTRVHFWKHRRLRSEVPVDARVLARFDDGAAAWIERKGLLIWMAGWHAADGQMALSSKFVPLLYSLLDPGEPPAVTGVEAGPEAPGIRNGRAVNLAPSEGDTAPMPLSELEAAGVKIGVAEPSAAQASMRRLREAEELEGGQKLWRWLLVSAITILLIETWLAGRASRQGAPP